MIHTRFVLLCVSGWRAGVYDCTAQLLQQETVVDEVTCTLAITDQ